MKQSESIANLATALAKVHQHVSPVVKDRQNPHFKNNYATLDAIMESVRDLLAGQGLAVVQGGGSPVSNSDGNICGVSVETMLVHVSGEFVTSAIVLPLEKPSPQAVGSAITYGRRYGVAALLALTTEEDDDGNVASANAQNAAPARSAPAQASRPRPVASQDSDTAYAPTPARGTAASGKDDIGATDKPSDDPACPVCQGKMFDNRATKRNPRAPDFVCRNKATCEGKIWPERAGAA